MIAIAIILTLLLIAATIYLGLEACPPPLCKCDRDDCDGSCL